MASVFITLTRLEVFTVLVNKIIKHVIFEGSKSDFTLFKMKLKVCLKSPHFFGPP